MILTSEQKSIIEAYLKEEIYCNKLVLQQLEKLNKQSIAEKRRQLIAAQIIVLNDLLSCELQQL